MRLFHKREAGSVRAAAAAAIALLVVLVIATGLEHTTRKAQASAPSLTLDMDPNTGGIQSSVNPAASSEFCVAVVTEQVSAVAAFNFELTYDQTLVDAPEVTDTGLGLEDNPDMNSQTGISSVCAGVNESGLLDETNWHCDPVYPKGDNDANPALGRAFISCYNIGTPTNSGTGTLAYVRFTTGASTGGPITIGIENASITDDTFAEVGSCNPVISVSMPCTNGSVTVGAPAATNTPTNTPVPTDTPTATPTPLPGTVVVNTTADTAGGCPGASCSLRGAITYANANPGTTIVFNIPGGGAKVIAITANLPVMTAATTIDGTTQPGYSTTPLIVIDGGSTGSETIGLQVSGGNSTIKALNVRNINTGGSNALLLMAAGGNTIQGNFIGTNDTGTSLASNVGYGIYVDSASPNNTIGGSTAATRNVIGGNGGNGIYVLSTGNTIKGNYIGIGANGTTALANGFMGVYVTGNNNIVGGTSAGERNVISGNSVQGVYVTGDNNQFLGNYIGLNAAGTAAVANSGYGIRLGTGADSNTIGGTTSGARNVISGNTSQGVRIESNSNTVEGNYIGLAADGMAAVGNSGRGVNIYGTGNTIGGSQPGSRNVIGSNGGEGINVEGNTNVVTGNYIGVAADGTTARANSSIGVYVGPGVTGAVIGRVNEGNIIAWHAGVGIQVDGCSLATVNVEIRGNSIFNNSGGINVLCANGGISPPTVTASTFPPQGTTCPSCWVDVYSDSFNQGRTYHGSVQADGSGNWKYWDHVDGPNITAITTDASGNSSAFSTALTRAACASICLEGLWEEDFSGTSGSHCTAWTNQSGTVSIWGHVSCVNGAEFNFDGALDQGTKTAVVTTYYINPPGAGGGASGAFTVDGNSVSGSWFCNIACAGSGTWTAIRHGSSVSIPAGGGSSSFVAGVPAALVLSPAGSPAITVNAVPLQNIATTVVRTGYDFLPHGLECLIGDGCTPVQLTVNYNAATDLPPAPATCDDLAQYKYDPATGTSTFESRVSCNVGLSQFTTPIRSFSVHRFEVGRDSDGDGIDDGADVCPLVADVSQTHSDANILDFGSLKPYDDVTQAWGDDTGDACDSDGDRDNDGLTDTQEALGCGFGPTNPLLRDSDGDLYLDKAECQIGTNPNLISNKPTLAQCGLTTDPDSDGIPTFREFCNYGTDPSNPNSDGQRDNVSADTCSDGQEMANVNGDFSVASIDLSQVAQQFGPYTLPANLVKVDFDMTKDGTINASDLGQIAQRFSGSCQSFAAP